MNKPLLASAAALALFACVNMASAQTPGTQGPQGAEHAQTPGNGHGKAGPRNEFGARNQAGGGQARAQEPNTGRETGASQTQRHAQGEKAGRGTGAQRNAQGERTGRENGTSQRQAQQEQRLQHGSTGSAGGQRNANAGEQHNRQAGGGAPREGGAGSGQVGESRGGAGNVSLSTEQRNKIRTVITGEHVRPATNANINISVGTVVPSTVVIHPLPTQVVTLEPTWRGFEFFLVGNEIVIVNPATLRIVAVMPA
jgi:hypothetical protein